MKTLFTKLSACWAILISKEFFLTYSYKDESICYLFDCDTQFLDNTAAIADESVQNILTEQGAIESFSIIHPN
jgi:hypothetical protein